MELRACIATKLTLWLNTETPPPAFPVEDFQQLSYEVRPCDILLVKGRTRVSEVIKTITQSAWSHATIYIGRLHDIEDPALREMIRQHYQGPEDRQLLIEGLLGKGTVVTELNSYNKDHIRICRPSSLSKPDAQKIVAFLISHLGDAYDLRQLIDLARFIFPWAIMPRRWRSSLFNRRIGDSTRAVCSSIIAEAFHQVNYPILPVFNRDEAMEIQMVKRNPRLFTPADFDLSPYFDIIKNPVYGESGKGSYRNLPWAEDNLYSPDGEVIIDLNEVNSPSSETTENSK